MKRTFIVLFIAILALTGCRQEQHFISDPKYRAAVEEQFAKQRALAQARDTALFAVFNQSLSVQEEEALKFLYAYMPLSDLADYNGEFFLKNVRTTFAARDTFSWGKTIPEEIFRHFVLPVRVNNENLDTARIVFFNSLKSRVAGLSMKDAVLEVNHWCHENVSYRSTDSRTSSPLATVQTAYGRCGEESTLTVAALRSVGIPARQCYTPRWAHTDDNHAWVEVWVDGKWYFIGACEPEFELNIAWFTGPAQRAMIVGTNVYGDYRGPEEVLFKNEYYTRINLISNYAPVKTFWVKVLDTKGKPCDSAEVEFCLYNYAEFFPVARKFTDEKGLTQLNTGLGDMLVWANNTKDFGFEKVTVEKTDTITITLNKSPQTLSSLELDFVPPVERPVKGNANPKQQEKNRQLLKAEDSIRNTYIASFADSLYSIKLAAECGLNADSVWYVMNRSEGNWKSIESYLRGASKKDKEFALPLLYAIAEKDLRDSPSAMLLEHLQQGAACFATSGISDKNFFVNYVINPRISIEMLRVFRTPIKQALGENWGKGKDAKEVIDWVNKNMTINNIANYYNVAVSPAGTLSLRVSDKHSRDILFVAICRTYGFPARIESATRKPQYYIAGSWTDVNFEAPEKKSSARGFVKIINASKDPLFTPTYYVHYTLAFFKDGKFRTLDYEGAPELSKLPATLELECGNYMLVTGSRRADGSVLSALQFFSLGENEQKEIQVRLRDNPVLPTVLGKLDLTAKVAAFPDQKTELLLVPSSAKCQLLIWIDPDKEPTKHVITEIEQIKEGFDKNASPIILIINEKMLSSFDTKKYISMPGSTQFGTDLNGKALQMLESATKKRFEGNLPLIAVVTKSGDIVYLSSGYSIGTGEQLLKVLNTF